MPSFLAARHLRDIRIEGNGIFEISEDLVGFERLAYVQADEPELFAIVRGFLEGAARTRGLAPAGTR